MVPDTSTHQSPTITWVPAPLQSERPFLDRWCAGVGPAVATMSVATDTVGVESLAIVSWNTNVGSGDIAGLVDDLRIGRFSDGVPVTHFVLMLQEVYRAHEAVPVHVAAFRAPRIEGRPTRGDRRGIVETARTLGLHLYYVPSMANGRGMTSAFAEDRGNAILSTLPLSDLTAIELPLERQRRVVAAATVSAVDATGEPWSLRLVNVHFENRSRSLRFFNSLGPGRTRQARALIEAIGTEGPTVLGGDLNTWSMGFLEGAVELLEEHFPLPKQQVLKPTLAVKHGVGAMRLDRLMFRLPSHIQAELRRLDDPRGSDHYPLLGFIRIGQHHTEQTTQKPQALKSGQGQGQ